MSQDFGLPYYFQDGTTFLAEQVNADLTALLSAANSLQDQIDTINTGQTGTGLPSTFVTTAAAYGMSPTASPAANLNALQLAVNAALASGGGTVYLPTGQFQIAGTITFSGTPPQGLIIAGASGGSQLLQQNPNSDTFQITNFSAGSSGGMGCRFKNFWIQYQTGNTSTGTGIGIHVTGSSQNVSCDEMVFFNCPQAFQTDNNTGLQCGVSNSLVVQNKYSSPNVGQIQLGGTQQWVDNCLLRQGTTIANGGPRNNIGIMTFGGNSCRMTNTQISDFDYGVYLGGGSSLRLWLTNMQIESYTTGIYIQPNASNKTIYGVYINACNVQQTSSSTSQSPGIYIDTNGGANTNVESINITNCIVVGWANSGIQLNSCRSVNIVGGMISSNGLNPSSTLLGCGVTLSNGSSQPSGIHLVGVDMVGVYDFNGGTQPYAIGVTGGGSIRCWSCTMTGNGSGQVFTTAIIGTPDIKLYNCTGYNDSATSVNTATISSGNAFTLAGLGYYGPGTFYVNGGTITSIVVGSVTTHMGANSTIVIPDSRTSVNITWSGSPTNMTIVGG